MIETFHLQHFGQHSDRGQVSVGSGCKAQGDILTVPLGGRGCQHRDFKVTCNIEQPRPALPCREPIPHWIDTRNCTDFQRRSTAAAVPPSACSIAFDQFQHRGELGRVGTVSGGAAITVAYCYGAFVPRLTPPDHDKIGGSKPSSAAVGIIHRDPVQQAMSAGRSRAPVKCGVQSIPLIAAAKLFICKIHLAAGEPTRLPRCHSPWRGRIPDHPNHQQLTSSIPSPRRLRRQSSLVNPRPLAIRPDLSNAAWGNPGRLRNLAFRNYHGEISESRLLVVQQGRRNH